MAIERGVQGVDGDEEGSRGGWSYHGLMKSQGLVLQGYLADWSARYCAGGVDVRLPGKGNSNSHGARPVHLIITMM